MQSHRQQVDCQDLQPLHTFVLKCEWFYLATSLAVQIFLSILYSWTRRAASSFTLTEIDSTVICKEGLGFLAITQNAWIHFVNVWTLLMCLAFNSPILDSARDPSSSFLFFTQQCTSNSSKPSACATAVSSWSQEVKLHEQLQAWLHFYIFFASPWLVFSRSENLSTFKWKCTKIVAPFRSWHTCANSPIRALADRSVLKSGVQESTSRLNQKQAWKSAQIENKKKPF